MGGINSGRRPDVWERRPQVEDALIIDIPLLRAHDALTSGTHGILHWTRSKSECAFLTHGDELILAYALKGRAYQQSIHLAAIPLRWNNGTSRTCLLCSQCGRRGYKLYLSRRQPYFLCRVCQGLVYELQAPHYGGLCYALLRVMRAERRYASRWERAYRRKHKHSNQRRSTR
jgi:hypothetical protein